MDWPDTIPLEIPPQLDWDIEQNIPVLPIRREINLSEIPQLESDTDEEEEGQFEDLQTYLTIITPTKRVRTSTRNTEKNNWTWTTIGSTRK